MSMDKFFMLLCFINMPVTYFLTSPAAKVPTKHIFKSESGYRIKVIMDKRGYSIIFNWAQTQFEKEKTSAGTVMRAEYIR